MATTRNRHTVPSVSDAYTSEDVERVATKIIGKYYKQGVLSSSNERDMPLLRHPDVWSRALFNIMRGEGRHGSRVMNWISVKTFNELRGKVAQGLGAQGAKTGKEKWIDPKVQKIAEEIERHLISLGEGRPLPKWLTTD